MVLQNLLLDEIPTQVSPGCFWVVEGKASSKKDPIYKMYAEVSKWSDSNRKMGVKQ